MRIAQRVPRYRGSVGSLVGGTPRIRRAAAALLAMGWLAVGLAAARPATRPVATQPTTGLTASPPTTTLPAASQPVTTTRPAASQPTTTRPAASQPVTTRPAVSPPTTMPGGEGLLMNFRNASLQAVLEYLSEAGGLVILNGADADGRVTVMSRKRVSTDEAVDLLDTILKEQGFAAVRTGRLLKIVSRDQAAKENLPVISGGDPADVPLSDRMVTQIIPVKYAQVSRLRTDLAPLISEGATLSMNEASNSLILIDTQTNIRRVLTVIKALDQHMAGVAEIKVYRLKFADAATTSQLINELFKDDQNQRGDQQQRVFMPFGRGGGPPGRGSDRSRGSNDNQGARQQNVTATADNRTNTLVVSAPPDLLKVIDGIIEELDSDPTEEQSVFVYPLKNAQATNLETVLNNIFSGTTTGGRATGGRSTQFGGRGGTTFGRTGTSTLAVSTSAAAGAGDLAGQVYVVADEDTNSLIIRTAAEHVDRVKAILKELDKPIRQVLIKVLLAEVSHDDTTDLGVEFSALNIGIGSSTSSIGTDFSVAPQTGGLIGRVVDADYTVTLRALATVGKLDVLSRPYILASDNQEATITVGQEVPFIRNTRTTETGQTINTIEYEDIGIILNVTPHINPEGLVILDVAPEISTLTGTTVPISETVDAEVFAKRSAETRVAIRNGQTIVIGGMMEDRLTDTISKVPLLGDDPILGPLFRRTIKKKVKTELLIFLTPHVAEQPEQLYKMSQQEKAGSKGVPNAAWPGAFQDHMKGMRRGATTRPAGPTTRPAALQTVSPAKATPPAAGDKDHAPM